MRGWLADARKKSGLTQRQVADALDISEGYYSFIESNDRQKKMDIALAAKLSVVFGIPIAKIIEMENSE